MPPWLNHKQPSALDEARMHLDKKSTKVGDFMRSPESQYEVDGSINTNAITAAAVSPNTICHAGSFGPPS